MYSIYTFPAVKLVEFKGTMFSEKEAALMFHGKVGGVMLTFSVFGALKDVIKAYGLKAGDYMAITAESKVYQNKEEKQDESYNIISAVPVQGNDKAVWPTVFFPTLKVLSLSEGEAKTGKYYKLFTEEMKSYKGKKPLRNLVAWTGGSAGLIEQMKLKKGSEIAAVATAKFTLGPEGKRIDYTLLSFEYLTRAKAHASAQEEKPSDKNEKEEVVPEPAFDESIIDMPEPEIKEVIEERKPVKVEFNPDDFEKLFL